MLGSPKQRDLLPGVTYDQAVGYAIEVFNRVMPAIAAAGGRPVPRAAGAQRYQLPQYLCAGYGRDPAVAHPHFKLHMDVKAQSSETAATVPELIGRYASARRPFPCPRRQPPRPGMGDVDFGPIMKALVDCAIRSVGVGGGIRFFARSGIHCAAEHRVLESVSGGGLGRVIRLSRQVDRPCDAAVGALRYMKT